MPLLRVRSLIGLFALIGIAWLLSRDRRAIDWRLVAWGVGLQIAFGVIVLLTPAGTAFFQAVNELLLSVLRFSESGARFLFGDLVFNTVPVGPGTAGPGGELERPGELVARTGAYFAFHVLPTIIFVSSLMAVLYHLRVMQKVVRAIAWAMQRTMGTSGAETLSAAGTIFVGLMETPLLIRPYLDRMTRSELMALMTAGLATVSGGVLAAYVGMLSPYLPDVGGHLIAASVMSAPAALAVAKIMLPETEVPVTRSGLAEEAARTDVNLLDAAGRGATEGLFLALKVGAMLIAFLALLEMLNAGIGWLGGWVGRGDLSLQMMLGVVLAPISWMVGVPWSDALAVGELIGVKTVLNEFVAYQQMSGVLAEGDTLTPRSTILAVYALAGFANFGSVAMQIAGIGELAPNQRASLAQLGIPAMVGGTIAALMTAAVAGMLL